jgi:hypothetical protein
MSVKIFVDIGSCSVQIIIEAEIRISFEFEMGGQPAVMLLQFLANFVQEYRVNRRIRMRYRNRFESRIYVENETPTPMNDQRHIVRVGRVESNP